MKREGLDVYLQSCAAWWLPSAASKTFCPYFLCDSTKTKKMMINLN